MRNISNSRAVMHEIRKTIVAVLFGIAALVLTAAPARATVIYSYTGNNFDSILDNDPPAGTYDTTMSVSGFFTVAAPLLSLPAGTDVSASVLSYSFSDGQQTLGDANSSIDRLLMSTDAAGVPIDWDIILRLPYPTPTAVGDARGDIATSIGRDMGSIVECTSVISFGNCTRGSTDQGRIEGSPGRWVVSGATVPEPSTLLLFGLGLVGLGEVGRRRGGL